MTDAGTPNQDSIATWNEILVPKFVRFRHILVDGFAEHSKIPLSKFGPKIGDSVLDVGCGFGETTIELAQTVGPTGRALGIDCASGFIDVAKADAQAQGIRNATFRVADAQVDPFEPQFDFVFSRFGTMFFQSPVAALRNIRRGMKPGGRLLAVVWRPLVDNEWAVVPKNVVRRHLPPPPEDGRNCGPGPFSMADPETTTEIFAKAGFSDIVFTKIDVPLVAGNDLDEALAFQLMLGPAGEIVREAGDLAEQKRSLIEKELREALGRHMTDDGVVLGSSSWAITATSA
jgi:SAM-dependent methyltransferase